MNLLIPSFFSIFFIFQFSFFGVSQEEWIKSDLQFMKCFVENNGQINPIYGEKILFTAHFNQSTYYFIKDGFYVVKKESLNESIAKSRKVQEKLNSKAVDKQEDKVIKYKTSSFSFKLISTNESKNIFGDELTKHTFSYGIFSNSKAPQTIKANAYSKLIYKNVYSGIDLVFEFPKNKAGLKYYFVLKPGSNPSSIKIDFPDSKIEKLNNCQVKINTDIGVFYDQIDSVYLFHSGKKIECAYTLNKNQIGFDLNFEFTKEKTIIDPWLHDSISNSSHRVYDVDYDSDYNVYALYETDFYNPKLIKFSPSGDPIWVYTPIFDSGYHGDFAIDRVTNNIFLVEGFNPSGARVVKIDKHTNQLAFFSGDLLFAEMWRISFSNCTRQAVIAGGGTSNPTYQTCFLDTNLTNMTMVQYVNTSNCCHDVNMLALDENGYCYQVTNNSSAQDGLFDNHLVKLPLPNLLPIEYNVPTGYHLQEIYTNAYYNDNAVEYENGYNGIATAGKKVYTYDSYRVKKWDGQNGNLISMLQITPYSSDSTFLIHWGGIAVDVCQNLYVGNKNNVLQYDSSFNLINTYVFPDSITDIMLGTNGNLFVSGYNFVATINPIGNLSCNYNYINIYAEIIEADCNNKGTASINIIGGTPPYDIVWNTIPIQTGITASDLDPGEYIVTVNDFQCQGFKISDTVVIGGATNLTELLEISQKTNVFTPNDDLTNEMYFPFENFAYIISHGKFDKYNFVILNRWGNVVFETDNLYEGWSGKTADGVSAQDGVYYWKLEIQNECDTSPLLINGFLHLVR